VPAATPVCERHIHVPASNTMTTFRFVTRFPETWPKLVTALRKLRRDSAFLNFSDAPGLPDVLLVNNGPWQVDLRTSNKEGYKTKFREFIQRYWGSTGSLRNHTSLLLLGNTVCDKGVRGGKPMSYCRHPVAKKQYCDPGKLSDAAQRQVISDLWLSDFRLMEKSIRYVDSQSLFTPAPVGYNCTTPYHLPGVVTDARSNRVLKTLCASARHGRGKRHGQAASKTLIPTLLAGGNPAPETCDASTALGHVSDPMTCCCCCYCTPCPGPPFSPAGCWPICPFQAIYMHIQPVLPWWPV